MTKILLGKAHGKGKMDQIELLEFGCLVKPTLIIESFFN